MDNGMTEAEYDFFMRQDLKRHCIMGNDYYGTNEHYVAADGKASFSGEIFGYNEITSQYYWDIRFRSCTLKPTSRKAPKVTKPFGGFIRNGQMFYMFVGVGPRS